MAEISKGRMKGKMAVILALLAVAMLLAPGTYAGSADENRAQRIVDRAQVTLNDFIHDPKNVRLRADLDHAKGVLIFPKLLQGGFILGGSGGTGVFLVRNEKTGNWSHPAFLTIGSISLGLQLGGEASAVVMLAKNQEAIDAVILTGYTMGGNASIALGPVGAGAERSRSLPDVAGKFISFAKSKGLYTGLNLAGSIINERTRLEAAYYGKDVTLDDIILMDMVSNKGADGLRETLKNAASR
ncbi:MAG TPA: lipid-binding SYLF domain-containing protein [Thermodesulfobacteriota bacterium]|nr:lipid-binding SYLF domain-containing protein [Thermodesulfobacteriota bacterium]